MKRACWLVAACLMAGAAAMVGGCSGPLPAYQSDVVVYPQVHVESHWLQDHIRVQPPVFHRIMTGAYEVTVPLENLTGDEIIVDTALQFTNQGRPAEGKKIQTVRIPPHGVAYATGTSMSTQVTDFDLSIREAK